MQSCSVCGEETKLLVNGIPLCPKCDDKREEQIKARIKKRWEEKQGDSSSLNAHG